MKIKKILKFFITLFLFIGLISFLLTNKYFQQKFADLITIKLSHEVGYKINIDGYKFSLPLNLDIKKLELADDKKIWLVGENLSIKIIPSFNITHNLHIDKLDADKVTLLAVPEPVNISHSSDTPAPNIFINKINIKDFELRKNITNLSYNLNHTINGNMVFEGKTKYIDFFVKTDLNKYNIKSLSDYFINIDGKYQVKEDLLTFKKITIIKNNLIDGSGSGIIDIANDKISANLTLDIKNLLNLIPSIHEKTNLNISGQANINLAGKLYQVETYKGELNFLSNKESNLNILLNSTHQINKNTYDLAIENFYFANCKTYGNLSLDDKNYLINGKIKNNCPDINLFTKYFPQLKEASLDSELNLFSSNNFQMANLELNIFKLKTSYLKFNQAKLKLHSSNLFKPKLDFIDLSINDTNIADHIIDKASFYLTGDNNIFNLKTSLSNNYLKQNLDFNSKINYVSPNKFSLVIDSLNAKYLQHDFSLEKNINFSIDEKNILLNIPFLKIDQGNISLSYNNYSDKINSSLSVINLPFNLFYTKPPLALERSQITGEIKILGSSLKPQIYTNLNLEKIYLSDKIALARMPITANYKDNKLVISSKITHQNISDSVIDLSLPIDFSISPFRINLNRNNDIKGNIALALYIDRLDGIFLPLPNHMKGKLTGRIDILGNINKPIINGKINISEGGYRNSLIGLDITKLNADIIASGTKLYLNNLTAYDLKNNPIFAKGYINYNDAENYTFNFTSKAKNFTFLNNAHALSIIDADLNLSGNNKQAKIAGNISSKNCELRIPELLSQTIPTLNITKIIPSHNNITITQNNSSNFPMLLNIDVKANEKVFVRGRGLNAEIFGNLKISGSTIEPIINGKLITKHGIYQEFGKLFNIKEGTLTFDGKIPPSPFIYMVATYNSKNLEVIPVISGSLLQPKIEIKSNPSLPQEEALSRLLFATESSNISPVQAIQLANSLRKLGGYSNPNEFDPLSSARKLLGVDEISVSNNVNNPNNSVISVSKYISDKVYLQFKGGASQNDDTITVNYDITPNITITSSVSAPTSGSTTNPNSQQNNNNIGISWKRNY